MATLRSDIIVPEVFTPYVIEQSTQRDSFLASGVVQPMAELNATEGGDTIQVPFWKANLSGDFEVLSDSSSLTPGKIEADKQVGVILHRGKAWESRDLASLAAGSDPMAAIGVKVAEYVNFQRQKDLMSCLDGVFGSLDNNSNSSAFFDLTIDSGSGDTRTALSPRHVAQARAALGDQGDKLSAVAMHSKVYFDLVERRAIDYVTAAEARTTTDNQTPDVFAGSVQGAYGEVSVPQYMGMRVIVSDSVSTTGSGSSTIYSTFFFTEGAVASGEQLAMVTETDRDILQKSDAMAIDLHYCYHPVGARWTSSTINPDRSTLATAGNWSKVYETKNIGIVRASNTSNFD
jgi:hypothetical protein